MNESSFTRNNEPTKSNLSRRNFLTGTLVSGGVVAYGGKLFHDYNASSEGVGEVESEPAAVEVAPNSIEVEPKLTSEYFGRWKKGFQAWWVMPYHSVVYVNENNEPVSAPIAFKEYTIEKERIRDGKKVMEPYALKPGAVDEYGFLTGNFAKEWLNFVTPLVAKKYNVDINALKLVHITEEFEQALKSGDEKLIAKIRSGEIDQLVDLMHYYAAIPASETDSRNKITYIEQELTFTEPGITPFMASELRSLIPALCAKESLFKDRKPNEDGAQGIAQFKSNVWEKLGLGEYGKSQPFTKQVEAIGLQFGQIYRELVMNDRVNEMLAQIESLFVSRASFEQYFFVPLMVNSYNGGAGRMKEVVKALMENHPIETLREKFAPIDGMDFFFAMTRFAVRNGVDGYIEESPNYNGYIYALRDVLLAQKEESAVQLARN